MPSGIFKRKPKIVLICQNCGKKFETILSRKNQKFCSSLCYYRVKKDYIFCDKDLIEDIDIIMLKKIYKKKLRIVLICQNCGKKFKVIPYRKNQKFCSSFCYHKVKKDYISHNKDLIKETDRIILKKIHKKKLRITLICQNCGKKFKVIPCRKNQKFCSLLCYHRASRKIIEINKPHKGYNERVKIKKIKIICKWCGKEFEVSFSEKNPKFCDWLCYTAFMRDSRYGPTKETKEKISKTKKKGWQDPIVRERYIKARLKRWQNPEFQKMMAIAHSLKPNKLEQFFDERTSDYVHYVGNFAFFIVTKRGTRNPDFKVKDQKKVIELFGDYWHKGEDPKELIREYAEIGWKCIVFWEHEIFNNIEQILEKTLKFIKLDTPGQ